MVCKQLNCRQPLSYPRKKIKFDGCKQGTTLGEGKGRFDNMLWRDTWYSGVQSRRLGQPRVGMVHKICLSLAISPPMNEGGKSCLVLDYIGCHFSLTFKHLLEVFLVLLHMSDHA